jgi:hypothetical protein
MPFEQGLSGPHALLFAGQLEGAGGGEDETRVVVVVACVFVVEEVVVGLLVQSLDILTSAQFQN